MRSQPYWLKQKINKFLFTPLCTTFVLMSTFPKKKHLIDRWESSVLHINVCSFSEMMMVENRSQGCAFVLKNGSVLGHRWDDKTWRRLKFSYVFIFRGQLFGKWTVDSQRDKPKTNIDEWKHTRWSTQRHRRLRCQPDRQIIHVGWICWHRLVTLALLPAPFLSEKIKEKPQVSLRQKRKRKKKSICWETRTSCNF